MVAYSFKPRFVDPILWGRKDGTIRAERRAGQHAAPGAALQLYTGMRTQHCRLILKTTCVERVRIVLRWAPVPQVYLQGRLLKPKACDQLAQRDGFDDFKDMERFWAEVHPGLPVFSGSLIRWRPPAEPAEMGTTVPPMQGAAA